MRKIFILVSLFLPWIALADEIKTYEIEDLKKDIHTLTDKVVRIKFQLRDTIEKSKDGKSFTTWIRAYPGYDSIDVIFSQEAVSYISKAPTDYKDYRERLKPWYVYAMIVKDGTGTYAELIGREMKHALGKSEFIW